VHGNETPLDTVKLPHLALSVLPELHINLYVSCMIVAVGADDWQC
jgi:hypothetical protein